MTTVTMNDDGALGDAVAGDGVWSATLPGFATGTLVAFHIEASDRASPSLTSRFPNDAPVRECLVRYGDPSVGGSFGVYRFWYTQATSNQWSMAPLTSNEPYDATFVYGDRRVIYNASVRYAGSFGTSLGYSNVPNARMCGYALGFPSDDRLLGATEATMDWPVRDETAQREQVANWIASQMGLPNNYRRFVHLIVNGVTAAQRYGLQVGGSQVYEDTQRPNSDTISQWFADSGDGHLYQFDDWNELDPGTANFGWYSRVTAYMTNHLATNFSTGQLEERLARYRVHFTSKAVGAAGSDNVSNIVALIDTLNTTNTDGMYTTELQGMVDADQWMRVFAFEDVAQNSDSFGNNEDKNMFAYRPLGGLWRLLIWDLDASMGETASCAAIAPFFSTYDPALSKLESHPPFRRAYWRGIQDAVNGPLLSANIDSMLDGNYAALTNNGITVISPDTNGHYGCTTSYTFHQWLQQKRGLLTNALAGVSAPFEISNNGGTISASRINPHWPFWAKRRWKSPSFDLTAPGPMRT